MQATFATGKVTVTGNGTVSAGDLFETAGGVQFRAGESIEVKGTAEVLVSCVTAGAAGNVAARTVTAMLVQIAGISAVTNPESMTGGYDAESDKSLMERFLNQLQHPATSGNAWNYSEWAHEVAGVGEVIGHGAGTVDVTVLGSDGKPASSELVREVQDYIDPGSRGDGMGAAPIGAADGRRQGRAYAHGILAALGIQKHEEEHWAQKFYDSLRKKGIVIHEERFDDKITRGEVFALLDQVVK